MIKEWWLQRTTREQKLMRVASALILLLLLYLLILSPVSNTINSLEKDVAEQQSLLQWMRSSVPQLQSLRAQQPADKTIPSSALLGTVDHSLTSSGLKSTLAEMKQIDNHTVQLQFNSVSFDDLMDWLVEQQQSYGIVVSQISLNKNKKSGYVEGEVTLNVET